jgi:general nucleoside transport system ATP-binding protein
VADPVAPAVSLRGITKRFPGVVANDRVDFDAAVGEVHALLGENGAGKSTLSHILTGLYRPDEGEIFLYGERVDFASPREAIDARVCMVHQHFRLVERFTVAENLMLGDAHGAGRAFRIDAAAIADQVRELAERYRLAIDPNAHVWQLSAGERQRVEILNALYQRARILILDEPTAVLTPDESRTLFVTLREMVAEGRTVIFISHKLHEVKAVSDRVTVLRGGRAVATVDTASSTRESLASLMVGRAFEATARPRQPRPEQREEVLAVEGLTVVGDRGGTAVDDVTLTVHAGEILALAGVSGNGQRELAEAITGFRSAVTGSVRVGRALLPNGDARAAFRAGVGYVPEDRLGTAVSPNLSLAKNIVLKSYRTESVGPFLRLRRMNELAERAISAYDVKTSGPAARAATLSGGNLQKIVLAREFGHDLKVLIAASPTQGLDVAAVETVHAHLVNAAEEGVAVLLISEDLDEILELNDRILVMYEGQVSEVTDRSSVEEIGLRMAGEAPGG